MYTKSIYIIGIEMQTKSLSYSTESLYDLIMISASQVKAARALIGWSQNELSEESGVSIIAIKNFERGMTDPRLSTIEKIKTALEEAGVCFISKGEKSTEGGEGVRLS